MCVCVCIDNNQYVAVFLHDSLMIENDLTQVTCTALQKHGDQKQSYLLLFTEETLEQAAVLYGCWIFIPGQFSHSEEYLVDGGFGFLRDYMAFIYVYGCIEYIFIGLYIVSCDILVSQCAMRMENWATAVSNNDQQLMFSRVGFTMMCVCSCLFSCLVSVF